MTSEHLQPKSLQSTAGGSTSLLADSPVRILATPESESESKASAAAFGERCTESFARYDRESLSWKTSQLCLDGEWEEFSETWPRAGSMRSGIAFRSEPLADTFYATACLSLPKVPSPVSADHKGAGRDRLERGANNNLRDYFAIKYNMLYPPVAMVEYLLGFPIEWSALNR